MRYYVHMFNARGRINRTTFLLGNLIISALALPLYAIDETKLEQLESNLLIGVLAFVLVVAAIYFSICLFLRRLHDLGLSAWFVLLAILPGGQFVLLILPGQKQKNNYGERHTKKFDWQTIFSS